MTKLPLTGWAYTDATRQVACPRCQQTAGNDCRTPKGRKTPFPHVERLVALSKVVPSWVYVHRQTDNPQRKLEAANRKWLAGLPIEMSADRIYIRYHYPLARWEQLMDGRWYAIDNLHPNATREFVRGYIWGKERRGVVEMDDIGTVNPGTGYVHE